MAAWSCARLLPAHRREGVTAWASPTQPSLDLLHRARPRVAGSGALRRPPHGRGRVRWSGNGDSPPCPPRPRPPMNSSSSALLTTPVTPLACAHGRGSVLALWAEGLSPSTRQTYQKALTRLAAYLGVTLDALPGTLLVTSRAPAFAAMRRYRASLLARGRSPSTVNIALAAVRSLVAVARELELVDWSLEVPSVRVTSYRDTRGPGHDGMRALLAAAGAHPTPWRAARRVVVVRLLYDMALRCGELTALRDTDLERDPAGRPIAVHVVGKGRHESTRLELPGPTQDALARWLAVRPPIGCRHAAAARLGGRFLIGLGARAVAKELARIGADAGLGAAVHPHALRHAAVTQALDAGHSATHVRAFSRHHRLETVLIYDDNRTRGAARVAADIAGML